MTSLIILFIKPIFPIPMLKKLFFLLLFAVCAVANQAQAQSIFDKWATLKAFHGVMSQTFHPAEEGNLEPIKKRSGEMVEKATALAKSDIPAEFKTEKIQTAVKKLQKGSKALDKMVKGKKASDADITKSLSALHDVFHEIVGLCKDEKH